MLHAFVVLNFLRNFPIKKIYLIIARTMIWGATKYLLIDWNWTNFILYITTNNLEQVG
jgi:hypothetical protein